MSDHHEITWCHGCGQLEHECRCRQLETEGAAPETFGRPDRCATCRFWDAHEPDPTGYCRRRAPALNAPAVEELVAWPITHQDDWCGEYQPFFPIQKR